MYLAEDYPLKGGMWVSPTFSLLPALSLILALKHNAVPYWLDLHLMHVPLPLSFSAQGLACTAWGQNGQRKWTLREVGYKIFV